MLAYADLQRIRNEDLVLGVSPHIDRSRWDESRYEAFLDELCGYREYQKEAVRVALRYLLGGEHASLRSLARANYERNPLLEARYGSWRGMERRLQLPDALSATLDLATGTGKSYVLYGIAAILLAEGAVDRVLVLCPSTTIEDGLLEKFRSLAADVDLRDLLPADVRVAAPHVQSASETITEGSICVENYHAILEHVGSSVRDSLQGVGARVAVLNDEAHHVANEPSTRVRRWKEFLGDPSYGFRYIIGVSGTCYVGDEYFSDVIYRYSLRQAMEENYVKRVKYVADMPQTGDPDEKWQLVRNRHEEYRRQLRKRDLLPLTIIVTRTVQDCKDVADELKDFLAEVEGADRAALDGRVLTVYNGAPDVAKLRRVDQPGSSVEWIVAVSMLNEGWDVKRVFQIVPHERRAFNSKLLIAQVLGRGLRIPAGWEGAQPEVTVFNHDAWAPQIRHLVNEVLEIERRLSSRILDDSPYHFELHNIDYTLQTVSVEKPMGSGYNMLSKGYVDIAGDVAAEAVTVEFESAFNGERSRWETSVKHKTYTPREIAVEMYRRLEEAQDPDEPDVEPHTAYTDTFPVERLEEIVRRSLEGVGMTVATDRMKQKFLQALGTLRRRTSQNVRYTPIPDRFHTLSTRDRQADSVSAAELQHGRKSYFFTDLTRGTLDDDQVEFFDEATDPGSGYTCVPVPNRHDFKTPLAAAIADSDPERRFINRVSALTERNASRAGQRQQPSAPLQGTPPRPSRSTCAE